MYSLKSLTPDLARMLQTTSATLYERQRVLVREGLLKQAAGRGPGSGVQVTSRNVAILLIATLSTESLGRAAQRTLELSKAPCTLTKKGCGLTGKRSFLDALEAVLSSEHLSEYVMELSMSRLSTHAFIRHKRKGDGVRSHFGSKSVEPSGIDIVAVLQGTLVRQIGQLLARVARFEESAMALKAPRDN